MLIKETKQLAQFVKIAQSTPFSSLQPYIEAATDRYLLPHLGEPLLEQLQEIAERGENPTESPEKWQRLLTITQKTLAPFALLLATHESSIHFGDTGHTVSRTDTLAPASDAKIAAYFHSLHERAWLNMELLLRFVELNHSTFADYLPPLPTDLHLLNSAADFQEHGFVHIDYSRLTFNALKQLLYSIEESDLKPLLGETLFTKLADNSEVDKPFVMARAYAQKYLAHKTAAVFVTKRIGVPMDYLPKLQIEGTNFYGEQASFFLSLLTNHITKYAALLDIVMEDMALQYNTQDNNFFIAEG